MKAIFCSMLFVIASVSLMTAQGTYTQIDFPGALATVPTGVNAHGDIVGYYVDSTGNTDGFLLSGGSYTTIMYPGAASTQLSGINDSGKIVGFSDASNSGFQYDEFTQTFTTITYPHANQTLPTAINNSGTVVGTIDYGLNDNLGFESVGSKFRRIAPPASSQVFLTGIAGSGQIVGTVFGFFSTSNFLYLRGAYQKLQISNAPGALVTGINSTGTVLVGSYMPSIGTTASFLYQNNNIQTLQFPGSQVTHASGINSAGEVVGYFQAGGPSHGFTWTPPADAAAK